METSPTGTPRRIETERTSYVRTLSREHYRECSRIFRESRSLDSFEFSTSPNMFMVLCERGGFVVGSFVDDVLVGYCLVFPPMIRDGVLYWYVDDVALLPEFKNQGLAPSIFEAAVRTGLERNPEIRQAEFTYDPLRSRLAHLYLNKYGCVVTDYKENALLDENTGDNSGLDNDRFSAVFFFDGRPSRIQNIVETEISAILEIDEKNVQEISKISDYCKIRIPADIDLVRNANLGEAKNIRLRTRKIMSSLLSSGFYGIQLIRVDRDTSYYIFQRRISI